MALQQPFESGFGISLKDAYHKIVRADFDFVNDKVIFYINIYAGTKARLDNRREVFTRKVTIDKIGDSYKVQKELYDWLKTNSNDYAEAVDC
jgi:hypothetical protein